MGTEYLWIPAVIGAVSAVGGGVMTYQAQQDAKKAAEKNQRLQQMETAEEARRLEKEQQRTEALTRAKAAATGAGGESFDVYFSEMETEHNRELNWLKLSGASKNSVMKSEADAAEDQSWAQIAGYAGQAAGSIGSYDWS